MKKVIIGILSGTMLAISAPAAETSAAGTLRDTMEVIEVLRAHYVDRDRLDEKALNDATTQGLLTALGQGATIVTPAPAKTNAAAEHPAEPVTRAEVIEPQIGYIRIADAVADAVPALDTELKKFAEAKVQGYVLDLRFSDGTNYTVAAALAARFLGEGPEVFAMRSQEAGAKVFKAGPAPTPAPPKDLLDQPLVVLINSETTGSAEALAGALQAHERAVLIGGKTAGSAAAWEDVKLSDGRLLRIATAKVVLPAKQDKSTMNVSVFPDGVKPDVPVKTDVKAQRELFWGGSTNMTLAARLQAKEVRKRMGEAELVKAFRGESVDLPTPGSKPAEPDANAPMSDPVLQRAVDILKGIRVLLSLQSP